MIRFILITPGTFPSPRDSSIEQAYASPVLLEEKWADSDSVQRHERKKKLPRAFRDEDGKLGDDGRRRRHRGSSNDEGHLTTDGFTNSDLPVGGPYLCLFPAEPLCILVCHPITTHLDPWIGQIRQGIQAILNENGVDLIQLSFVLRQSTWDPEDKPISTVLILARRHEVDDSWLHAAREIRDFLDAVDLQDLSREIADPEVFKRERFLPVLEMDTLFPKHYDVINDILKSVDLTDVMSVSSWRRGTSSDDAELVPTVVVMVGFRSTRDWRPVREQIFSILDQHGLPIVAVEVSKNRMFPDHFNP